MERGSANARTCDQALFFFEARTSAERREREKEQARGEKKNRRKREKKNSRPFRPTFASKKRAPDLEPGARAQLWNVCGPSTSWRIILVYFATVYLFRVAS